MDYSWPAYYHLTIKNDVPTTIVSGYRMRLDLALINELGMFRGDDILAECPIGLRVIAVPLEDTIGLNKTAIDVNAEILTRNVRVKPFIEKNGHGSITVLLSPTTTLHGEDSVPFLLQISVTPSSRVFPHVIPACSKPLVLVSPESKLAEEFFASQIASDDDDDEDDEDGECGDSDCDDDECHGHSHGHAHAHAHAHKHCHGDDCDHDHDHEHDDEDEDEYVYDDEDEDMYEEDYEDEDEDEDEDDDVIPPIALATDGDLYIFEDSVPPVEAMHSIYHAFVADEMESSKPSPKLVTLFDEKYANSDQTTQTVLKSNTGINIQGMQYRRAPQNAVTIPSAVMQRRQAPQVVRPGVRPGAPGTSTTTLDFSVVKTGFQSEGKSQELLYGKKGLYLLDPLCGSFMTNRHQANVTKTTLLALKRVSYAYIQVIQGSYIGARMWDGAIYLMRALHRIITQNQTWLDGLRVLEIGAGTGVLGIWLYHMMLQRARSQVNYILNKFDASERVEILAIMQVLSTRDITAANKFLLGNDPSATSKSDANNNKSDTSTTGMSKVFNISTKLYDAAVALLTYTQNPCMIVSDLAEIMPLLRQNASYNEIAPIESWYDLNTVDNIVITKTDTSTKIEVLDTSVPVVPAVKTPIGLHALQLDWAKSLSPGILKSTGVYLLDGSLDVSTALERNAQHNTFMKTMEEITRVLQVYPTLDADDCVTKHYITDMDAAVPFEIKYPVPNDIVLASECLYNDRYFPELRDTINRLFDAYKVAYYQRQYVYSLAVEQYRDYMSVHGKTVDESRLPAPPTLQYPLVLLSYRLRASHEQETIDNTFFAPLQDTHLHYTSVPLDRVLNGPTLEQVVDTSFVMSNTVMQRTKERQERESAIRNGLADLDADRKELTRLAVMYYAETKEDGRLEQPTQYLSTNATFFYKLFQAL